MNLEDKTALENLIFRYARLVDIADYGALGEMFRHGRITANQGSDPLVGADAIRQFYATTNRTHADGTARTHHIVTNLEFGTVEPPGKITVRSCFTVFQATKRLALQPIVCGRYEDRFARRDGGWHYEAKHIDVTLIGELAEHLTIALR